MRLEEWQKFIESQFLEDGGAKEQDAKTAPEVKPAEAEPVSKAESKPVSEEPANALPYVPVTVKPTVDAASHEAKPLYTPLNAEEMRALTLPFAEEELADAAADSGTAGVTAKETNEISPHQILDFDAEIPEFSSYLPAHRANKSAPDPAPILDAKAEPKTQTQTSAREAPVETHHVAVHENRGSALSDADEFIEDAPVRAAINPRSRARHARNVQPKNVGSGLSAADMWADVPRHVQTLLALERIEEKEIAQSSYKRPFAEGRLELIERLLDPILSLEDTARLLNVCPTTVRRYTNRGILTHYRKETERGADSSRLTERETRQRRFRLSDILAFLETQQSALTADTEAERAVRRAANKAQTLPS